MLFRDFPYKVHAYDTNGQRIARDCRWGATSKAIAQAIGDRLVAQGKAARFNIIETTQAR